MCDEIIMVVGFILLNQIFILMNFNYHDSLQDRTFHKGNRPILVYQSINLAPKFTWLREIKPKKSHRG